VKSAVSLLALLLLACSGFRAGTSAVDITPSWPVPLGGFGARQGRLCEGVHDRVFARALWLDDGSTRVVVIATDLIGTSRELRDAVRKRLGDVSVILAATHTHSGPGGLLRYPDDPLAKLLITPAMGAFDPKYHESCVDRLVEAATKARDAAREARPGFASVDALEFTRNRRAEHYEGAPPVDPALGAFFLDDRPAMLNYTAHGTVLGAKNVRISADWCGPLAAKLDCLVTNGAEGDIAPNAPAGADAFERCVKMAEGLAAKLPELVKTVAPVTPKLRYVEREITLPKSSMPFMPKMSVIGLLFIGEAVIACVPGEMGVELGLALKQTLQARGFRPAWLLGLANDHLGYFLTEEQFRKGGYEASVSFYGAQMGPWLVSKFLELAKE
jgi:hypothetical protein